MGAFMSQLRKRKVGRPGSLRINYNRDKQNFLSLFAHQRDKGAIEKPESEAEIPVPPAAPNQYGMTMSGEDEVFLRRVGSSARQSVRLRDPREVPAINGVSSVLPRHVLPRPDPLISLLPPHLVYPNPIVLADGTNPAPENIRCALFLGQRRRGSPRRLRARVSTRNSEPPQDHQCVRRYYHSRFQR